MLYTSGVATDTNNVVVYNVSVINGKVSVAIDFPERVKFSNNAAGTLHDFLVADPDDGSGVTGGIRYVLTATVSFPSATWKKTHTFRTRRGEFGFSIPSMASPQIKIVVGASVIVNTTSPAVTLSFSNTEVTIDIPNESLSIDGIVSSPVYVEDLPITGSVMRFSHYDNPGMVVKITDKISREIPANLWTAAAVSPCPYNAATMVPKNGRAMCKWYTKTMGCRRLTDSCNGFREDCLAYIATTKCDLLSARELFTAGDEFLEVTESNIKKLFSKRSGFGYMAEGAIPGYNPEAIDGQEFGLLNSGNKCDRTVFGMLTQAAVYGCHKFESSIPDKCGKCYASNALEFALKRTTDLPLWRYIKPDGRLDLTYTAKAHSSIKLKTEDVPITYQGVNAINRDLLAYYTQPYTLSFNNHGGLEPEYIVPADMPDGQYEIWVFAQNTLGITAYMAVQPTVNVSGSMQRFYSIAKAVQDKATTKDVQIYEIPASVGYTWVQIASAAFLSDLCRMAISVDQKDPEAPAAFQSPGELNIKSVYIERVR